LLAKQTLAVLQGGLVLTQVRRDPEQMRAAAAGALAVLRAAMKKPTALQGPSGWSQPGSNL
jgi:hypothetical protein